MGIQEDVEALKRIPLFAKVEPAKLKLLAFAAERTQYDPGEALFHQGDQADAAYIVLGGKADVLVNTPNGPLKVAEVTKDAFVGEIGILCDVPRTATIQATESLITLKITKDLFYRMVADFPSISLEVMRVLAQRLEHMNEQLRDAVAAKPLMPEGSAAGCPVGDELRAAYARDGVVVIRGAFTDWVETLRAGFERNLASPGPFAIENVGQGEAGRFFEDYCNWPRIPEFKDFILNSPAAEIAGRIMGARTAQIFHEHILVKEPGTAKPTPWHQDMPYYCVSGRQTASYWIPLDPVSETNTLRALKTSHRWPKLVRPKRWASNENFYASEDDFMDMPAIGDDDPRILIAALEPGDAIVFDFHCVHGAPGNRGTSRRRAFSARYVGDDVTFLERQGRTSPPFPGIDQKSGERLREDWFPTVWRA